MASVHGPEKDREHQFSDEVLDLPLEANEGTDWNSVGDKLITKLVKEARCISLVDHKNRKRPPDGQNSGNWEFTYEKDNIQVFKKTTQQTSFAGRGVINVPLKDVADFVKDLDTGFIWKKFIKDVRCERIISDSQVHMDYIAYELYESNQYCGLLTFKREMLYFMRCSFTDGKYVQSAVSVDLPERPRQPDIPRVDVFPGTGFVLEQLQGDASKTLATFFGNVDLKGLPSFMMSQVLKRYPLLLIYIRQYFMSPRVPSPSNSELDITLSSTWNLECTQSITNTANYEDAVPCQHYIHQNTSDFNNQQH